ncbi:uncharacterized protein N7477_003510, partial [Penicillium maclennaniae]|uniref:uncharacterized protein n=1 Tax=Penicillium maclennaniae TaxID=1343394 RepID=UPI00254247F6
NFNSLILSLYTFFKDFKYLELYAYCQHIQGLSALPLSALSRTVSITFTALWRDRYINLENYKFNFSSILRRGNRESKGLRFFNPDF